MHGDKLKSLGEVARHRTDFNEAKNDLAMFCGECGRIFNSMHEIAEHVRPTGF